MSPALTINWLARMNWTAILSASGILLFPPVACADMVWPAIVLESRLATWWSVSLGLAIEFLVVWKAFDLSVRKAIYVDLAANAASVLLGVILIPFFGFLWEMSAGGGLSVAHNAFHDFWLSDVMVWVPVYLLAVAINAWLEWAVIVKGFKLPVGMRGFFIMAAANGVSVAVALGTLFVFPFEE